MASRALRVSVGTSATRIDSAEDDRVAGTAVQLRCPTTDLYLGGSDVTTSTGYLVPAGDTFGADLMGTDRLYAVVASGTAEVHVFRVGVA